MSSSYDAIVVGAGHNGLVAAAHLARAGMRVVVFERRDSVGGCLATESVVPGYDFETGAHRVSPLVPSLASDLDLKAHGLEVVAADPTVFAPALEGPGLLLWRDPDRTAESIRAHSEKDAEAWRGFAELIGKAAGLLEKAWRVPPPDPTGSDPRDLWSALKLGIGLRRLGRRDMAEVMRILPMSVTELLDDWFESDLLKGTVGAAAIAGLCQGPMAAGTAYTLLHHHVGESSLVIRPTWKVRGGSGQLAEALASAGRERGVEIRTGAAVERILTEGGRSVGVALAGGEEVRAAAVLSNADPRRTFFDLVDPVELDPEFVRAIRNFRFRGVCAKVHLVLGELPSFRGAPEGFDPLGGVVSISPSLDYLERAYDDAKYGGPSRRPVLEVSISRAAGGGPDSGDHYLASILMQYAPYQLREGTWSSERREALGDSVVETLAEYAPGLESAVLHRHVYTPSDLEEAFGLTEGNIYHGELTLDQLLFMRPAPGFAKYKTPIDGLYLCGAGAHPGGGVTGLPGANAAREVLRDAKR